MQQSNFNGTFITFILQSYEKCEGFIPARHVVLDPLVVSAEIGFGVLLLDDVEILTIPSSKTTRLVWHQA